MSALKAQFTGEVSTMWEGGPDRRVSPKKTPGATIPLAKGGFGGSYVCQVCQSAVAGVYLAKSNNGATRKWVCGECRSVENAKIAKPQPKHLHRRQAL